MKWKTLFAMTVLSASTLLRAPAAFAQNYEFGYPTHPNLMLSFNKDGSLRSFRTDKVLYENYKDFSSSGFNIRENLLMVHPDLWENYRDSVNYMLSQANQSRPLDSDSFDDSKVQRFYEPQKLILETIAYAWLARQSKKPENWQEFIKIYEKNINKKGLVLDKKTLRLKVKPTFAKNRAYTYKQIEAWKRRVAKTK